MQILIDNISDEDKLNSSISQFIIYITNIMNGFSSSDTYRDTSNALHAIIQTAQNAGYLKDYGAFEDTSILYRFTFINNLTITVSVPSAGAVIRPRKFIGS